MRYTREEVPFAERSIIIETEDERLLINAMIQLVLDKADVTDSNQFAIWNLAYAIKYGV